MIVIATVAVTVNVIVTATGTVTVTVKYCDRETDVRSFSQTRPDEARYS